MTRIVFMGTPEFAVPSLQALINAGYEIAGVFTQPDRPVGRGHKVVFGPVKQLALDNGIEVYQFERVRKQAGLDCIRALAPDLIVTAAFGQILSQKILDVPRFGTVNVHASLLPAHRGSAPINWCLINGDKKTGVTTMLTDVGIDTGDMLLARELAIAPEDDAETLTSKLSVIGAELLIETLDKYLKGEITPVKQDESRMTHEPMLQKETGRIDWSRSAKEVNDLIRGVKPWPVAYTEFGGGVLKIYEAKPTADASDARPGEVIVSSVKSGLKVKCGSGALEIISMQAPGAKRMEAKAYLMGKKIDVGTVLGAEER